MRSVRISRLAAVALFAGLLTGIAGATSFHPPAGEIVFENTTRTARWLQVRDLLGHRAVSITRRPRPGEIRRDCCASWSPDGARVAFLRRTPSRLSVFVVDADGRHLHRIVEGTAFRRWTAGPIALSTPLWSRDGTKLLLEVDHANGCDSDGLYRVNVDGTALRPLWRRPVRARESVRSIGWSPDGGRALFSVLQNDGDCYGSHVGPEDLFEIEDGEVTPGAVTRLAEVQTLGVVSPSPDGSAIAFEDCPYGAPCDIFVVDLADRRVHSLTDFRQQASPIGGFDELPLLWTRDGVELVYARGLSVFALDPVDGDAQRIAVLPCPRRRARCRFPQTWLYDVSPDGVAVLDVEDHGCVGPCPVEELGDDVSRRYALRLGDRALAPVPVNVRVDDIYLAPATR